MKRVIQISILLAGIFLISSCTAGKQASRKRTMADTYNPSRANIHPDFSIHHVNDSNSVAYVRVFPAELLFNQANEQAEFLAGLSIHFEVREILENQGTGKIIDSATINRTLNRNDIRNSYFSALPLRAIAGNKYSVEVILKDVNRGSEAKNYLIVDKTSPFNDQNFRVLSPRTGYPVFRNTFGPGDNFTLQFNQMGYDSLYVDFYKPDRSLPRPVFSTTPEMPLKTYPDSVWTIPLSDSLVYNLPKEGIYHFRVDLKYKAGLSLFNFGESFPAVKNTDDLLGPLIYLTSSSEFRDLRMEPNRKLAIDNFWLGISSGVDDARELIRVYYNRVLYANSYFTSYKEGWKTDRGMIYIIFGAPDLLEKTAFTETWTYYAKRNSSPIEFVFDRKENLFTHQEYNLRREMSSTSMWTEAVRTWRRGKIYSPDY